MAKKKLAKDSLPTEAEVDKFNMLENLIESIYDEMKEFCKKKPDEPLNKFKVKNVNRVLRQVKDIMQNDPTIEFLDVLDEDTLPSNSDTILVLAQFKASMQQFKLRFYFHESGYGWRWRTKENP